MGLPNLSCILYYNYASLAMVHNDTCTLVVFKKNILWLIGTNGFIKNMLALFKRANEQCSCC